MSLSTRLREFDECRWELARSNRAVEVVWRDSRANRFASEHIRPIESETNLYAAALADLAAEIAAALRSA